MNTRLVFAIPGLAVLLATACGWAAAADAHWVDVVAENAQWDTTIERQHLGMTQGPWGDIGGGCAIERKVVTEWTPGTSLDITTTFTLQPGQQDVQVLVAVDNDVQIFVNGHDITGHVHHDNCAFEWDNLAGVPEKVLKGGENRIHVHARDQGGDSYLGVRVRALE